MTGGMHLQFFNVQYLMAEVMKECIMQFVCVCNDRRSNVGRKRDTAFAIKADETLIKTCHV